MMCEHVHRQEAGEAVSSRAYSSAGTTPLQSQKSAADEGWEAVLTGRLCPVGAASKVFKQGLWDLHNRFQLRRGIRCCQASRASPV